MATYMALYVFVAYLALEPYARRRWPELLIAWARLVAGRVRDPLVARHVLIGIIGGIAHYILSAGSRPFASALDGNAMEPLPMRIGNLWDAVATLFISAEAAFAASALTMVGLVVLTLVLRKRALAGTVLFALYLTYLSLAVGQRPASIPLYVVIAGMLSFIMLRYGPVAVAVTQGTFFALMNAPLLPGAGWAMAPGVVTLAVVIALALWAFHTSLGGQPAFSASLLDE